ncbi:MAG: uncharacterized protein KVP18_000851 [Porospora cf. gigantea A]|uniref:uncharacterized protein n=1 Tax=Porospora cf. gigantea A TaxID=2853593 RepID=UPI0035595F6D|nr:MAG: hypothetical protein KVP18_000851 [Porospora cf. gigantea A]
MVRTLSSAIKAAVNSTKPATSKSFVKREGVSHVKSERPTRSTGSTNGSTTNNAAPSLRSGIHNSSFGRGSSSTFPRNPPSKPWRKKRRKKRRSKPPATSTPLKLRTPSHELATIVGCAPIAYGPALKKVWTYIKRHDLQDPTDRTIVHTHDDPFLKNLFPEDRANIGDVAAAVGRHLDAAKLQEHGRRETGNWASLLTEVTPLHIRPLPRANIQMAKMIQAHHPPPPTTPSPTVSVKTEVSSEVWPPLAARAPTKTEHESKWTPVELWTPEQCAGLAERLSLPPLRPAFLKWQVTGAELLTLTGPDLQAMALPPLVINRVLTALNQLKLERKD